MKLKIYGGIVKTKFPNALSGIKKIYAAEILTLIAGILSGTLTAMGQDAGPGTPDSKMALLAALFIGFAVLSLLAYILNLAGTIRAAKDESSFRSALLWIVIELALAVVTVVFRQNQSLTAYLNDGIRFANIFVTVFIIQGVINLANRLGNEEQARRGKKVLNIIVFIYALSFVLQLINHFIGTEKINPMILAACGIAALVLLIIAYFTFLRLLSRARKMLEA